MKIKLWTLRQSSQVEELLLRKMIPAEAAERALNVVSTLDKYYGAHRDVDHDYGGYLLLYTGCVKEDEELKEVLLQISLEAVDEGVLHNGLEGQLANPAVPD